MRQYTTPLNKKRAIQEAFATLKDAYGINFKKFIPKNNLKNGLKRKLRS